MIFGVNVGIGNATGGVGMVRCGAPCAFQYSHCAESLQRNAAPVGWRTGRLQTALAFSAVLIKQHAKLPLFVPPQSVWAQEPTPMVVYSRYRVSACHRPPNQTVDILH
jgi:hypothetical protein